MNGEDEGVKNLDAEKDYSAGNKKLKVGLAIGGVTAVALFAIILAIALWQGNGINQLRIENTSLYTWFNTEMIEYDNSTLTFDRTDTATGLRVNDSEEEMVIDSTPFFFANERKALFPLEMNIVQPRANNGQQNKLPSLAVLNGVNAEPRIEFGNFGQTLGDAFLFDGGDVYFFVNPTKLVVDNDTVLELPAFSFATYNFNKELYVYDYDNVAAEYYENVENVLADAGQYRINLATDTFEVGDKSHLLIKNVGVLDSLK